MWPLDIDKAIPVTIRYLTTKNSFRIIDKVVAVEIIVQMLSI